MMMRETATASADSEATPLPAPAADAAGSGAASAAGGAGGGSGAALLSVCSARLVAANERVTDLEAQLQELTRVAALALRAQSEAEAQLLQLAHDDDGVSRPRHHDSGHDDRGGVQMGRSSRSSSIPLAGSGIATDTKRDDHHRGGSGSDAALAALTMERDSAVAALKEMCLALSRGHQPITDTALRTAAVAVTRPTTSKESDGHDHRDDHDDHVHHDALRPLPLAGDSMDPPLLTAAATSVLPGGAAVTVSEPSGPDSESFASRPLPLAAPVPVTTGSDGARVCAHADASASSASASDRVQRIRLIVAAQLAARAHRVTMTPAFEAAAADNA